LAYLEDASLGYSRCVFILPTTQIAHDRPLKAKYSEVAQFAQDFHEIGAYEKDGNEGPAVKKALKLMLDVGEAKWRAEPKGAEDTAQWVRPFQLAVGSDSAEFGSIGDLNLCIENAGPYRFLVARMGTITSYRAYTKDLKPLRLPKEFECSPPWSLSFSRLPGGLILAAGASIQIAGYAVGVRLVWLKPNAGGLAKVGEYTGRSTLDWEQPIVSGDKVSLHTQDDPVCFADCAAALLFERVTTWQCDGEKPHVIRVVRMQPELRFVDQFMAQAARATEKSPLQRQVCRIRHATIGDEWGQLDTWKTTPLRDGVRVVLEDSMAFDLRKAHGQYRLIRVFATP
jgi:hypothetical protein